jgi:hypothetical protein
MQVSPTVFAVTDVRRRWRTASEMHSGVVVAVITMRVPPKRASTGLLGETACCVATEVMAKVLVHAGHMG